MEIVRHVRLKLCNIYVIIMHNMLVRKKAQRDLRVYVRISKHKNTIFQGLESQ